jgi:nitric oxide reductase subunit B
MLFFIFGLGAVLCIYGYYAKSSGLQPPAKEKPVSNESISSSVPTAGQRATYKFFAVAVAMFFLQIVAGVLTIHDLSDLQPFSVMTLLNTCRSRLPEAGMFSYRFCGYQSAG